MKQQCVGQGVACPLYQTGLQKQQRTNILIGATAGTAGLTAVIGLFFTNWHGKKKQDDASTARIVPAPVVVDHGALVGARGTF